MTIPPDETKGDMALRAHHADALWRKLTSQARATAAEILNVATESELATPTRAVKLARLVMRMTEV